ncbi:MAG: hypothetical protein GEV06_24240 [Luteitalea sp.]|nr:hypothetical protein [Luteitalea sp.]
MTLLERDLPFMELSLIAQADRRSRDPAYSGHSWFARRPPGAMRGLLLAAALPHDTTRDDYWTSFASAEPALSGLRAHDPFAGGGTILVEAARLGAEPSGMDVDPLAVQIVKHELCPPDATELKRAAARLAKFVQAKTAHLYAKTQKGWTPLHYFFVHEVTCPACSDRNLLYRDLVVARDLGKHGGVVRRSAVHAFCPQCLRVHQFADADRKTLICCSRTWPLYEGPFSAQSFKCPGCGTASMHAELKTAACPRRLIAVEETREGEYRRIRAPNGRDRELLAEAQRYVSRNRRFLTLPSGRFKTDRIDARPVSLGIIEPVQLFTDRQLAVFGRGFRWLEDEDISLDVRRALTLGLSNALATNNKFCGYARDYGRIAPLFSVRGYSLPALSVELNPFHPKAGRGTLPKILERLVCSCEASEVRRYVWSVKTKRPSPQTMQFAPFRARNGVRCESAASRSDNDRNSVDLCVFDPPYFDYIAYSELSEFHRAWLDSRRLGGTPLLPDTADPVGSFATSLADCLREIKRRLRPGRPLAFTYHAATSDAWDAVGRALDASDLLVTALWPLRNDVHMGHHTASGNCEWDVVVVCRRASECRKTRSRVSVDRWRQAIGRLPLSDADLNGMKHAIAMARNRFGEPS